MLVCRKTYLAPALFDSLNVFGADTITISTVAKAPWFNNEAVTVSIAIIIVKLLKGEEAPETPLVLYLDGLYHLSGSIPRSSRQS